VALLGRYLTAAEIDEDIGDPYGRSPYHYRLVQSQISMAIKTLADRIEAGQV
jgi:hypothetical protein